MLTTCSSQWPLTVISTLPKQFGRGRSVVSALNAHLVFVTKYRRGVFNGDLLDVCKTVMEQVCLDFGVSLIEFNGEDDHVHLLIEYPPTVQLSRLVNSLKGVSARMLRTQRSAQVRKYLWEEHFWSPSYFVGSAGGASLDVLRTYIENQRRPS